MNWLALRNWREAERAAAAALAQNPGDEQATADLVEAYRRQDRFDEALAVCTAALERRPSPQLHLSHALVLNDMKKTGAAVAAVISAFELLNDRAEEDALSSFITSQAFAFVGRHDLALAAAHRAVVLNPSEPRFMSHLGELLVAVDPPLAEQRLRQSLRLDAHQADALNNLGAAFLAQKRLDEAAAAFRAALALAPGFTLAKTNLWVVRVRKRRGSPVVPVGLFLCACSLLFIWIASSFIYSSIKFWSYLAVSMGFLGLGLVISSISNRLIASRLARRDPELAALMHTLDVEINEGRIGYREMAPWLRVVGLALCIFGALVLLGTMVGEVLVLSHFLAHRESSDLLGMFLLLLLGVGAGGLCAYEGRKLMLQAKRLLADRG